MRVVGENTTWSGVIARLEEVQGVKYASKYLPESEAKENEERARKAEDEDAEMLWSVMPLATSGYAIVPGDLDNDKFSFKPESVKQTFERLAREGKL
jgi:hypothetical protein